MEYENRVNNGAFGVIYQSIMYYVRTSLGL